MCTHCRKHTVHTVSVLQVARTLLYKLQGNIRGDISRVVIASECDCIQLTKMIFIIILIILATSTTGDSQLKSRQNGDLAPLYPHFGRQRDARSERADSLASTRTFIIRLCDNAPPDDQRLIELLRHRASLTFDQPLCHWKGVTTGLAVPLNATALHWVRQAHPHIPHWRCFLHASLT